MDGDPPDPGGGLSPTFASLASLIGVPNGNVGQNVIAPVSMEVDELTRKRQSSPSGHPVQPQKKANPSQVSSSIQSIYVHPDFSDDKKTYSPDDSAPYIVHVSKKVLDPSAGTVLRPIKFGHFLHFNKIRNVTRDGVKRIGRNRVSVEFYSADDANSFLRHPALAAANYDAIIPSYSVTRMGIVRQVPVEWTLEELVSSISVPEGFGQVIKARRMNRKTVVGSSTVWVPTQTVVLTFLGQRLPERVFCFYTSLPVVPYILPSIQCNKCCKFGHVMSQCRSNPRCFICAQPHLGIECSSQSPIPTCLSCSGPHKATDPSCPEHHRQKSIKLVMSQENISYTEAAARYPRVRRSFADAARASPSVFSTQNQSIASPIYQPINSTSYRKTVSTPKHAPAPASGPGFDRRVHQSIISSPPPILPNGSALSCSSPSPNDNLLDLLVSALISFISRFDDSDLPNNINSKLTQLFNKFHHGQVPPMELSQYSP